MVSRMAIFSLEPADYCNFCSSYFNRGLGHLEALVLKGRTQCLVRVVCKIGGLQDDGWTSSHVS